MHFKMKNASAIIIRFVLVSIISLFMTTTAFAAGFNSEVKKGVAVLATTISIDGEEEELFSYGTCFFVGDPEGKAKYLVSNHHVVSDFLDYGEGEEFEVTEYGEPITVVVNLYVYFDAEERAEAVLIDYDEDQDLALLKLKKSTTKRHPLDLKEPDRDMIGQSVYAVGFPALADSGFRELESHWGVHDMSVTTGVAGRFLTDSNTGARRIQTDCQVSPGNSGGPLVDTDGAVIGVNVEMVSDNQTYSQEYYAVDGREVIRMLDDNDIYYHIFGEDEEEEIEEEEEEERSILPFVLAGAGAFVLLIVILVIVLVTRKNKKRKAVLSAQSQTSAYEASASAVEAPKPGTYSSPRTVMAEPVVVSLSEQHAGLRVPVGAEGIRIGREENCAIRYADGTSGVSRQHCEVRWDDEKLRFIVKDLNSSYGTYRANGERLEPETEYKLKIGEVFYVGSPSNTLKLEY